MRLVKWLLLSIAAIIITLALLNPTNADFNYYIKANGLGGTGGRTEYYLVYSVFKHTYPVEYWKEEGIEGGTKTTSKEMYYRTEKYIGFCKNFKLVVEF